MRRRKIFGRIVSIMLCVMLALPTVNAGAAETDDDDSLFNLSSLDNIKCEDYLGNLECKIKPVL